MFFGELGRFVIVYICLVVITVLDDTILIVICFFNVKRCLVFVYRLWLCILRYYGVSSKAGTRKSSGETESNEPMKPACLSISLSLVSFCPFRVCVVFVMLLFYEFVFRVPFPKRTYICRWWVVYCHLSLPEVCKGNVYKASPDRDNK